MICYYGKVKCLIHLVGYLQKHINLNSKYFVIKLQNKLTAYLTPMFVLKDKNYTFPQQTNIQKYPASFFAFLNSIIMRSSFNNLNSKLYVER